MRFRDLTIRNILLRKSIPAEKIGAVTNLTCGDTA
jgi:hypothetical protein